MIMELLVDLLIFIPNLIISFIPDISIEIPDGVFEGISNIFEYIGYFLPIKGLLPIPIVLIGIDVAKFVIAVIIRIKSFIPTMGG